MLSGYSYLTYRIVSFLSWVGYPCYILRELWFNTRCSNDRQSGITKKSNQMLQGSLALQESSPDRCSDLSVARPPAAPSPPGKVHTPQTPPRDRQPMFPGTGRVPGCRRPPKIVWLENTFPAACVRNQPRRPCHWAAEAPCCETCYLLLPLQFEQDFPRGM